MWRALFTGILAIGLGPPAFGQSAQIEGVITDQFEDFRADDFDGAFAHASPMIRNLFGTPEVFCDMVRRMYPMVWRPKVFRFLDLRRVDGEMRQIVEVTDTTGQTTLLRYDVISTDLGWKIDGVMVIPTPDVAA